MFDLLVVAGFVIGCMGLGAAVTLMVFYLAFIAFVVLPSKEPPHDP